MNGKRFGLVFTGLLLSLVSVFASPGTALADVNNFTVTNFTADYYLTNQDPLGQMKVVEKINVDYTDFNHGILRALPESYKDHPLHVHVDSVTSSSGAPAGFTSSTSNGNLVLKIGDPNRTVTGLQAYTVTYTEDNVITFYNDHDELYWNINGDQWDQPFQAVHATFHLPAGLRLTSQQPKCFTGNFGSTSQQCQISVSGNTIQTDAYSLSPESTLTIVAGFQKGFFHPYTWLDYVRDYIVDAIEFFGPLLIIGSIGCIWWFRRGRDAKGTGVIIPQYDAPDNLKPVEVGTIVDFTVDNRDLTATIIDLAIRKYIRIIESDSNKLLVMKAKAYTLQLLNADWSGLNPWEAAVMNGLFGSKRTVGDQVDVAALATKLSTVAKDIKRSVSASLTSRGYFVSNPSKRVTLPFSALVIIIWVVASSLHGLPAWFIAGLTLGFIILAFFYHLLSARTAKGVAAKEHILGLKLYMEVAEKDRLKMLQSPDARYLRSEVSAKEGTTKTDAPAQTVELFEKLLPYAIALKVEQQWAKKFENIYKSPPDWYAGNYAAFNAGYLVGSLNSGFVPAVNSSFSAPRSSGGSGFGGGGFAGGGGGGGGGGGW